MLLDPLDTLEGIVGRTAAKDEITDQADKEYIPLAPNINHKVKDEELLVNSGIDPTELADLWIMG